MINTLFLWATVIIIALLIEAGAPGLFYFLSLAFGSAAAATVSYYGFDLLAQLSACLAVSCISLVLLRSLVKRNKTTDLPTNMHALVGQKVVVLENISNTQAGTIKIYGDTWLARDKNNQEIPAGTQVIIVDIQGCHLIVKKI